MIPRDFNNATMRVAFQGTAPELIHLVVLCDTHGEKATRNDTSQVLRAKRDVDLGPCRLCSEGVR